LTNDTEWAARITDPRSHLDKTHHAQVECLADEELLQRLLQGAEVEGELLVVKAARMLRHGAKNSWPEIVLDEGRNRHIRRLLGALGIGVLRLIRVAIGPVPLGNVGKGQYRELPPEEVRRLAKAAGSGSPTN
jgi:23S rRNA pseudouridine2605 synthase